LQEDAQRVLFVVPSEPLVWQVASYFSKLLREEGDVSTKVIAEPFLRLILALSRPPTNNPT